MARRADRNRGSAFASEFGATCVWMASGLVRRGARRKRRNRSTCRVPTFVFRLLSGSSSVPDSSHLTRATVEAGAAAVVGEALAGDGIDVAAAGGALGPTDGR